MNTAGADLETVGQLLKSLTVQGMVYFVLACLAIYVENFALKRKDEIDTAIRSVEDRSIEHVEKIGNHIEKRLTR